MELRQAFLTTPPLPVQEERIPPSQVWPRLTEDQRHLVLQTVVLVCQDLATMLARPQESEVHYE